MKKELNPLGEIENFVMLYSVWKIVSAYVDHTLINYNKLPMTINPEMMIKIPAILFTHFRPTKSK